MASKLQNTLKVQPTQQPAFSCSRSSSEGEFESETVTLNATPIRYVKPYSSEEEEEELVSESEPSKISPPAYIPKHSLHATPATTQQPASSCSPSSSASPIPYVKPIATTNPVEPVPNSRRKRPSEHHAKPYSKIPKKDPAVEKDSKWPLFQRLWSEDDESILLMGLLEYAEKGENPSSDLDGFLASIKTSVHFDVSRTQLQRKIKKLKRKYQNLVGRKRKGNGPSFSKAHDKKCFDLSKQIWGNGKETGVLHSAKSTKTPKKVDVPMVDVPITAEELVQDVVKDGQKAAQANTENDSTGHLKLDMGNFQQFLLKEGINLINGERKTAMEAIIGRLEFYLKNNELMRELAQVVLENYKSGHLQFGFSIEA